MAMIGGMISSVYKDLETKDAVTIDGDLTFNGSLFKIGTARNIYSKDVAVRYSSATENAIIAQLTDGAGNALKIPGQSFISEVRICVKTMVNVNPLNCNLQISTTDEQTVDDVACADIVDEILGAGEPNTDSSDSSGASDIEAGNIQSNHKEVWRRYHKSFLDVGTSDVFVYLCNGGTGNAGANPVAGTLSIYLEWFGLD